MRLTRRATIIGAIFTPFAALLKKKDDNPPHGIGGPVTCREKFDNKVSLSYVKESTYEVATPEGYHYYNGTMSISRKCSTPSGYNYMSVDGSKDLECD